MKLYISSIDTYYKTVDIKITQEMIDYAKLSHVPPSTLTFYIKHLKTNEVKLKRCDGRNYAIYFKGNAITAFKELRGFVFNSNKIFKITGSIIQWCDCNSSDIKIIDIPIPKMRLKKHGKIKWYDINKAELYDDWFTTTLKINNRDNLLFLHPSVIYSEYDDSYDILFDNTVCVTKYELHAAIINYCKNYLDIC